MELNEILDAINKLEDEKSKLIDEIKKCNSRLKYKQLEKKALEPFIEETKDVDTSRLRKKLRILEFKIATQAYTPRIERELVRRVKKVEEELKKYKKVEDARRKIKLINKDIKEAEEKIKEIEPRLKEIREELKKLYGEKKKQERIKKSEEANLVSLEEIAIIEKE